MRGRARGMVRTSWVMRERRRGVEGAVCGGLARLALLSRNVQAKLRLRSRYVGGVSGSCSRVQPRVAKGPASVVGQCSNLLVLGWTHGGSVEG